MGCQRFGGVDKRRIHQACRHGNRQIFIGFEDLRSRHGEEKRQEVKYATGDKVDNHHRIAFGGYQLECDKAGQQAFDHPCPGNGRNNWAKDTRHGIHKQGYQAFALFAWRTAGCQTAGAQRIFQQFKPAIDLRADDYLKLVALQLRA